MISVRYIFCPLVHSACGFVVYFFNSKYVFLVHGHDFIFLFFGIMNSNVDIESIRGSLMMPNWPILASLDQQNTITLYTFNSSV